LNAHQFQKHLAQGEVVVLTRDQWERLASDCVILEHHDTRLAGALIVMQYGDNLAVMEQPWPTERVIRPLPDLTTAQRFVSDRLATYERMWDGCGCKIDYYGPWRG